MEGGLAESEQGSLERHLADCDWCLERIGLISRVSSEDMHPEVSEVLGARARRLVGRDPAPRRRVASFLAAAATVLLAVSLLTLLPRPSPVPVPVPETDRVVRSLDPSALSSDALRGGKGIRLRLSRGALQWTPVNGSLFYQVLVVTDEGEWVLEAKVREPHWKIPADLQLDSGNRYFVRVEAHLTETRALESEFELLTEEGIH